MGSISNSPAYAVGLSVSPANPLLGGHRAYWRTNLQQPVNVAPVSSASFPAISRLSTWLGRCCWSKTKNGSCKAAGCSPPRTMTQQRSWSVCRLSSAQPSRRCHIRASINTVTIGLPRPIALVRLPRPDEKLDKSCVSFHRGSVGFIFTSEIITKNHDSRASYCKLSDAKRSTKFEWNCY